MMITSEVAITQDWKLRINIDMFFKKKPKTEDKGYTYKPRQFERDEKIAIQKIFS